MPRQPLHRVLPVALRRLVPRLLFLICQLLEALFKLLGARLGRRTLLGPQLLEAVYQTPMLVIKILLLLVRKLLEALLQKGADLRVQSFAPFS